MGLGPSKLQIDEDALKSHSTPVDQFDLHIFRLQFQRLKVQADRDKFSEILLPLQRLLDSCPPSQYMGRIEAGILFARACLRVGTYAKAVPAIAEAVSLAETFEEHEHAVDALILQCHLFSKLMMGRDSLAAGIKAHTLARTMGDYFRIALALNRIGLARASLGNYVAAGVVTEKARKIAMRLKDGRLLEFGCVNNLAHFHMLRMQEIEGSDDIKGLLAARVQVSTTASLAFDMAKKIGTPFVRAIATSNLIEANILVDKTMLPELLLELEALTSAYGFAGLAVDAAIYALAYKEFGGSLTEACAGLEALLQASPGPDFTQRVKIFRRLYHANLARGQPDLATYWLGQSALDENTALHRSRMYRSSGVAGLGRG